mmetsp:Transcript_8530/g.14659  ORF Transcript_8530/g.14659 Transcript_8530/m.14659 type:complete len:187 (+) Transcript_8530:179-739(+)
MASNRDSTLLDSLTFYGQYHANPWNQLIHVVFVPAIWWSVAVWLAGFPSILMFNGPLVMMLAYSAYYVRLEPLAGITWALCVGGPLAAHATYFSAVKGANYWAFGAQLLSWVMQIWPGHMILERRKPALLDGLVQAFSLAPLFVWLELLFFMGYRPKLHAELKQRVATSLAVHKQHVRPEGQPKYE